MPSWLGLDAPVVVTTWCLAVAQATAQKPPVKSLAVLFLVVWSIYLTDRKVDVVRCTDWSGVSGRMEFGRRWFWLFAACLVICVSGLIALFALRIPYEVIRRGLLVSAGLALYFVLFVWPLVFRRKLPGKEFGVGLFFALGCYCVLGGGASPPALFAGVALVVAYNCLVIAARDREVDRTIDPGAASQWWRGIDTHLVYTGTLLLVLALKISMLGPTVIFFAEIAVAFFLLLILHLNAKRFSSDSVRALADFCLLTPWPVLVWQCVT